MVLGWMAGRAAELTKLFGESPPPGMSPPPVAGESAPRPAKQSLDRHYEEFTRDNPTPPDYFSS